MMVGSLMATSQAQASVMLSEAEQVKLFGDVRIRGEIDEKTGAANDRYRWRLRARFGLSFQPDQNWKARIRLRTNSTNNNSPHQTFGTSNGADNASVGLDQAFVVYAGMDDANLTLGKMPINFWQQNELFWDTDIMPEGVGVTYKMGPAKLQGAYTVLADNSFNDDDLALYTYQAVFKMGKNKIAIGGANVKNDQNTFKSTKSLILSGQMKLGAITLGADIVDSGANTESSAWVVQGRYKMSTAMGVRLYYYNVEAYGLYADGGFTQDNFAGNAGENVNFKGVRLQFDYKVSKKVGIDLRYYLKDRINEDAAIIAAGGMQSKSNDRLQMNINLKL